MMNLHALTASQAKSYHEHQAEYYTKNLTNRDRWHGALATAMGLDGELSKEVFDALVDNIETEHGRKNVAFDITLSAPKSVSLALAYDLKVREDMIKFHQEAVEYIAKQVEQMLKTRITVDGKRKLVNSRNAIFAEFMHELARPTEANDFIPDLDIHSHLLGLNMTILDGQNLSQDWRNILNERTFKRLSMMYRGKLAELTQNGGYEIELTDAKQGFWELKGFPRETIEKYSHREAEVKRYAQEHGVDIETAKVRSRKTKKEASLDTEEIVKQTREDLFTGENKIQIIRKEVVKNDQKREASIEPKLSREQDGRTLNRTEERNQKDIQGEGQSPGNRIDAQFDLGRLFADHGQGYDREAERRSHLPDLSKCDLVATTERTDMLLSEAQLSLLEVEQTRRVRDFYMQRMDAGEIGGRIARKAKIDEIAKGVLDELQLQEFAFKLDTAIDRIMAAGVCENITEVEARRALDRAGVINAGQRIQQEGQKRFKKKWNNPHAPVYVTTRKNLETEKVIVDMFHAGQGAITKGVLTEEQSRKLLDEVENELIAKGETDFYISGKNGKQGVGGEQGEALHTLFCSKNRITIIEGWAGTGKTTAFQRANLIAAKAGIKIRGISFTNTAALNLQNESGIPSTSIHALLGKAERGELDEHDVINDKKLDEKLIQPEATTAEKLQSVVDAIGENFIEVLNNGHGASPDKHIPERTMREKVQRSLKEIFAEALLPPRDARKFKAKLRREDHKLYFQQQRGEVTPDKGADSKPLTGADLREDVLFDSLRDIISQDIFNIPDPEPTRNIPHRSMKGKVGRALKEILAEAFFDPTTAAKYRAELERQDEELFQLQQGKQPKKDGINKGKDKSSSQSQQEQDKIKNDWDLSGVRESKEPEVYIMDEAGLTDMHLFKYALEFCSKRGAKLCLLGDTGQLVPVGAGMPLKLLEDEGAETRYLTDIRRQKDKELREVAKNLANRNQTIDTSIKYYKDAGITRENRQQINVRKQKILDGANRLPSHKLQSTPILVNSYAERRQFNQVVRNILVERGDIQQGTEFQITDPADIVNSGGKRFFAEGDRVQFLETNDEIGASRGHFGTIEKIEGQNITVKTDKDGTITIDMSVFNTIDHGYATRAKAHELALPGERQAQAVLEATEDVKIADYAKNLLLVDTNEQRLEYNAAIRDVFVQRGELDRGTEFKITDPTLKKPGLESTRHFAAGDRVIFTKKDKKLKVENNLLGTVESIDEKNHTITIRTDMTEIGTVKVDMRKFNNIDHAYALTEYKGQGKTVDKAICVMDTKHSHARNDFYVAISRSRWESVLITDNIKKFEKQVQKFKKKEDSKDFAKLREIRERGGEIEQSDFYHYVDDQEAQMERAIAEVKKHSYEAPKDIPDPNLIVPDTPDIVMDKPPENIEKRIKSPEAIEKMREANRKSREKSPQTIDREAFFEKRRQATQAAIELKNQREAGKGKGAKEREEYVLTR